MLGPAGVRRRVMETAMTDIASISRRLAELREELHADLAAGQPRKVAGEATEAVSAAAASELALAQSWVKAHPLAAVGACLVAGVLAGGVLSALAGKGAGKDAGKAAGAGGSKAR